MAHPAQPPRRQPPQSYPQRPYSPQPHPQQPYRPYPQPPHPQPASAHPHQPYPAPADARSGAWRVVLKIVLGVAAVVVLISLLTPGADPAQDSGYSDDGGTGSSESCGSSEIYDSGSITTTCDGELIYSDTSGNSYSSGG